MLLNGIGHIPMPKLIPVKTNETTVIGLGGPIMVHPLGLGRSPVSPKRTIILYLNKIRVLLTEVGESRAIEENVLVLEITAVQIY